MTEKFDVADYRKTLEEVGGPLPPCYTGPDCQIAECAKTGYECMDFRVFAGASHLVGRRFTKSHKFPNLCKGTKPNGGL